MADKVSFNGITKIITVASGYTSLDIKDDVYSAWKDWVIINDNSKYEPAFSAVGGDTLPGGRYLGSTFFLENGWKIRPNESSHTLTVTGNLYSRDGASPIIATQGNYNVLVIMTTSNLIDMVATGGVNQETLDRIESKVDDAQAFILMK